MMPGTLFIAECLKTNGKPYKKRRFLQITDCGIIGFCSQQGAADGVKAWRKKNPGPRRPFRILQLEIPDGEE